MIRGGLPRRAALCAVFAVGCASAPSHGASAWRMPENYQANQVVHVVGAGAVPDFLASVRRAGDRVEVVLFDAALQVPILRATASGDGAAETLFVEGPPAGEGKRLAGLIRTMNALGFAPADQATLAASGDGWRFLLSEVEGDPTCRFPRRIEVEHRGGGPRILVETTDVACDVPAP